MFAVMHKAKNAEVCMVSRIINVIYMRTRGDLAFAFQLFEFWLTEGVVALAARLWKKKRVLFEFLPVVCRKDHRSSGTNFFQKLGDHDPSASLQLCPRVLISMRRNQDKAYEMIVLPMSVPSYFYFNLFTLWSDDSVCGSNI